MDVKQRQCLLAFLGFYVGEIDGIWGNLSTVACASFQKDFGLPGTGTCDKDTEKALRHAVAYGMPARKPADAADSSSFWPRIRYFKRKEFRCTCGKCGGFPVEPQEKLVLALDEFRERLGVPVQIVDAGGSGVRCKEHNDSLPDAAKNSQHLYGMAADLHSPKPPEEMYRVAEEVLGDTGGIGIYSWGIHFDIRPVKARWKG